MHHTTTHACASSSATSLALAARNHQGAAGRVQAWWASRPDAPVVGAWVAAGCLGVSLVDYIFSLPVLNLLFPAAFQALGIAAAAVAYLRYAKAGASPQEDANAAGAALESLLPGLKKD